MTASTIMSWTAMPCAVTLALLAAREQTGSQRTIVTSSMGVVVVLIPGFPIESILLGLLAGFITVLLVRLRRRRSATASVSR